MRPLAMKISGRAPPPGDMQGKTDKTRPSLRTLKKDAAKPEQSKYKPLYGKVFYLDVPSSVISEKLEKDLKELGGRVEGFLSKDISYLISNKKEAKFAQSLGQISPVPSPESAHYGGNSSLHPSSRRDRDDRSSFKMADTVRVSRGKSLVEKAIKEQELIPSGSILSNALSWGVKILHVDDIKNYIEQKKKEFCLIKKEGTSGKDVGKRCANQKSKTGRLKNPFVKVEDRSCHYRPFYLQLSSFPVLNYSAPKPYSPFEADKKTNASQKQIQSKQRNKTNSDKDCGGIPVQLPLKDKRKRGYCECCVKKFEDLQTHLESEQHQNFAQSTQYKVVDDIISKFVYDFVEYGNETQKSKRTKCSMGCFSPTTGSVTNTGELKDQLKRQNISLKHYSWKDKKIQALKQDYKHISSSFVQKHPSCSESVCQILACHLSCVSEVVSKFRNDDENGKVEGSCTTASKKTDLSPDLVQLSPHRDNATYVENLPEAYEHCSNKAFETEVNLDRKNLQSVQADIPTLCTHAQGTDFSEKDKNTSQSKRKLNNTVILPAKCLKKTSATSSFNKKYIDFVDDPLQTEHTIGLKTKLPHTVTDKELNELAVNCAHSSPSGKLHRKVKFSSGRHKRGNRKQKLELCVKQAEELSVKEMKDHCSPVQTLWELFQTSEGNSDFVGFISYSENKDSTDMKEICEGQNTNTLWSFFSPSSSSSSTFIGF
ncbi:protein DBF4 homolog A isoform X2 [Alligator mississippiensis]|uniref:protein DBF4 homolog A isoform X2 n=1 Tax=Alligator mississippiensis TaxID=8496 RepID=UPI000711AD08|nr:protein DBF4 homolog A isoform X2 [Alligator mississippiensis]